MTRPPPRTAQLAAGAAAQGRGRALVVGLSTVVVSWLALATASLFGERLYWLVLVVLPAAWLMAILVSLFTAVMLVDRRPAWAIAVLLFAVGAGLTIAAVDWTRAYATTWYVTHRGDFNEIAGLAHRGELGMASPGGADIRVPRQTSGAAVAGRALLSGPDAASAILYLPVWVGPVTDSAGFAHLPQGNPAPAPRLHVLGDQVHLLTPLGGGWWWYHAWS